MRTIEVVTACLEMAERIATEARQLIEPGRQLAAKSRYSSATDFEHAHVMLAEAQALLERAEKLTA